MKKSIVSALTTALVVGAASTTFAAANPFEDVAADHWAYDAIAQLAADGIVEGYGDGTFRGDQEITRYEMAQMVARAMAKNPSGADKALVDKLAAEFADELNNLGVRVAALEKKVDNVKWLGTIRYRYINSRHDREAPDIQTNTQYITLRLEPEMRINKNWTGHARLDYNTDMNNAANATGNNEVTNGDPGFQMERVWAQGDYDNFQILLGKLPYITNVDNGMFFDDNVSGGQITVGSKVKATLTVGRTDNLGDFRDILKEAGVAGFTDDTNTTASYQGIEIYNDRDDKITWGVGYHHVANKETFNAVMNEDAMNVWDFGLGWKIDNNFALNGAYAWDTAVDADTAGNARDAWTVELDYKGADPEDVGSWGAFAAYRQLGAATVLAPTYDAIGRHQKGVELGFEIIPMKNFSAAFKYFIGKDMKINNLKDNGDASRFFTELNFFF